MDGVMCSDMYMTPVYLRHSDILGNCGTNELQHLRYMGGFRHG